MMKILIVKTSSLGDIIHAFPALQLLRERYPSAQIDWVVEQPFAELVKAHPAIDHVYSVQTKRWRKKFWTKEGWREMRDFRKSLQRERYDLVFDLQGNIKSGLITWLSKSSVKIGFGLSSVPEWPNVLFTNRHYNPPKGHNIREDYLYLIDSSGNFKYRGVELNVSLQEKLKVDQIIAHPSIRVGKKIMVCPGSMWTNKQLTPETLKAFLQKIYAEFECRFVFVWGSEAEKQIVQNLAQSFPDHCLIADKLALPTLQNLMAQMDLVIAMDSLPLHLAGTTSTPVYSVFGASSGNKYKPVDSIAFQGSCPYGKTFEKRCPILRTCPTGSCIKDIQSEALFQHFTEKLGTMCNKYSTQRRKDAKAQRKK
jgi:heptosyltransferase I